MPGAMGADITLEMARKGGSDERGEAISRLPSLIVQVTSARGIDVGTGRAARLCEARGTHGHQPHQVLQRASLRRVSERPAVILAGRRAGRARSLAARLPRAPAPQLARTRAHSQSCHSTSGATDVKHGATLDPTLPQWNRRHTPPPKSRGDRARIRPLQIHADRLCGAVAAVLPYARTRMRLARSRTAPDARRMQIQGEELPTRQQVILTC